MARQARLVVPGHPHHVTQRGVRGLPVFLEDDDYGAYLALLAEWAGKAGTAVWAYCLMPSHVHLILVPSHEDGLRAALGETHRRYARRINAREAWQGHLWQERFQSFPMDEPHLLASARTIELDPVRAGLAARPEAWRWSSARAHLNGRDDAVATVGPLLERVGDWRAFLDGGLEEPALEVLRAHARSGHPAGDEAFLQSLEDQLGRPVAPRPPGRPRKRPASAEGC